MVLSPLSFRYPSAQTKQSSAVVPVHVLHAAWQPAKQETNGSAGEALEMNYKYSVFLIQEQCSREGEVLEMNQNSLYLKSESNLVGKVKH